MILLIPVPFPVIPVPVPVPIPLIPVLMPVLMLIPLIPVLMPVPIPLIPVPVPEPIPVPIPLIPVPMPVPAAPRRFRRCPRAAPVVPRAGPRKCRPALPWERAGAACTAHRRLGNREGGFVLFLFFLIIIYRCPVCQHPAVTVVLLFAQRSPGLVLEGPWDEAGSMSLEKG